MNILNILLNRVYCFLTKVKNQSPFSGTLILVAIVLNTLLVNLLTGYYILIDEPHKLNGLVYISVFIFILILLYLYAIKIKAQIIEVKYSTKFNFLVAGIFLFTLISFIWCANINREKLSKEKSEIKIESKKGSLEGKIKKLFE